LENLKGRHHLEDPGLDRKIILEWILDLREIGQEDVDWMHLTQNTEQWQALVKTVP
jgi:hypothetical protein